MNPSLLRERIERANVLLRQMEEIEAELAQIFGNGGRDGRSAAVVSAPVARPKKRGMSAAGRAKIAAAQRARWAKQKGEASTAETSKPARGKKKRTMSPEARAKIAAGQKKRWAKQKAAK